MTTPTTPHMRLGACLVSLLALAAVCAPACAQPAPSSGTERLPRLPRVTHVELTDATSGAPLGAVQRADSVAALLVLYGRLSGGWVHGAATSPEIAATFYEDRVPVAVLVLASGAFEARVGGRVLRRAAGPEEALAFARLAGIPVLHRRGVAAGVPAARPQ